MLEQSNKNHQ